MCTGHICSVPLMKVENCFISLPIQSALFSHTYTQRERWLILMEIIIPSFVVAMQCKAYQHCIAISTLPKICTTLHAALTTHIWYVYSTYNYLSGTCRPKRSYAAHMLHILLVGMLVGLGVLDKGPVCLWRAVARCGSVDTYQSPSF